MTPALALPRETGKRESPSSRVPSCDVRGGQQVFGPKTNHLVKVGNTAELSASRGRKPTTRAEPGRKF